MIKSKRTSHFYVQFILILVVLFYATFTYWINFDGLIKWGLNIVTALLGIITFVILLLALRKFSRDSNIIVVDSNLKIITFTNFIFRTKTIYSFEELDGYVTGRFIGKNRVLTKVIWVVKKNQMLERINEDYVSNVIEIENELKELKYLGYQTITNFKRIKMIFLKLNIEKESDKF